MKILKLISLEVFVFEIKIKLNFYIVENILKNIEYKSLSVKIKWIKKCKKKKKIMIKKLK